jgi:hypothetical protein
LATVLVGDGLGAVVVARGRGLADGEGVTAAAEGDGVADGVGLAAGEGDVVVLGEGVGEALADADGRISEGCTRGPAALSSSRLAST